MALSMTCDRCEAKVPLNPTESGRVRVLAGATTLETMDLCPDCKKRLKIVLENFLQSVVSRVK